MLKKSLLFEKNQMIGYGATLEDFGIQVEWPELGDYAIRSFYKKISDTGVDLAAIARQISSKSSFPQGEEKSGKCGVLQF